MIGDKSVPVLDINTIVDARGAIAGSIRATPMISYSPSSTGAHLLLKLENRQRTGSFKIRGAVNAVSHLVVEARSRGVVAVSTGNHGLGLAQAAADWGITATIAMPDNTTKAKIRRIRDLGGRVIIHGANYQEAKEYVARHPKEFPGAPVHSFDDPRVIAGQGTIGLEILEQAPQVKTVVVPIGGGGLISGVALAIKSLNPDVRIIGVEAEAAACAAAARRAGRPVTLESIAPTIAGGIAISALAPLAFGLIERFVDDLVTVSDAQIATAQVALFQETGQVAEEAGVAALAAAMRCDERAGPTVVVISGGNVEPGLWGGSPVTVSES